MQYTLSWPLKRLSYRRPLASDHVYTLDSWHQSWTGQKPNSWTYSYNFVEVSVLRLEVSVYNVYITTQFPTTFALGVGGGGELNPLVEMTVNSKEEKLLSQLRPKIRRWTTGHRSCKVDTVPPGLTDKKENQSFLIFKEIRMEQLQSHIWGRAS